MYAYVIVDKNVYVYKTSIRKAERQYRISFNTILKYKKEKRVCRDIYYFSDSILNREELVLVFGDVENVIEMGNKTATSSESEGEMTIPECPSVDGFESIPNVIHKPIHSTININNLPSEVNIRNIIYEPIYSTININNNIRSNQK